jgi:hypothetical protein
MQFGQSKSLKKTKNLESSSKVLKNQEQFSEETQKIVEQEVLKAKKELLDRLVSLEILKFILP